MKKLIALFLIFSVIFVFAGCGDKTTQNNAGNNEENIELTPSYSFEEGSIVNNVYTNNWANLKFVFPEDWQNGEQADYDSYETTENTYCGLSVGKATDTSTTRLDIVFEELVGGNADITESEYIDIIKPMFESQYSTLDVAIEIGEVFSQTIANERYSSFVISLGQIGVQHFSIRKKDNYIILINITTTDESVVSSVLEGITTAR